MSLRTRLLAAFAYVLLVVIVALEVPLALNVSRRVDSEVRAQATSQAQLVAASAAGRLDRTGELGRLARRAAADLGGRVIVVDGRGRLLADSAGPGLRSASYAGRPEVAQALTGRPAQGSRRSESLDQDLLFTAVPVIEGGRPVGAVRVTQDVGEVNAEQRADTLALVGVGLGALVLGLGLAAILAGSLSRPLRALAQTARRVGGGDLDARAEVAGSAEQREVALAFNEMTERLATALAAQRDFVANASHQVRTPLTGLRLRLESAGLKAADASLERDLAAAEREVERLSRLLDDLLTLASEGGRPVAGSAVVLRDVAASAGERWSAPAQERDQRLVVETGPEAVVLTSHADVETLLDNLVRNALDYSPRGTTVTLTWGVDGPCGVLAVLDEGPGIARADADRVFDRFVRGAAARGTPGTGLGLPIVRTLARRWGGEAALVSRPGGGTRAEVRLPLVSATGNGSRPVAGAGSVPAPGSTAAPGAAPGSGSLPEVRS